MADRYYCNRCTYYWSDEHPPYCPYCGGEPTHERAQNMDAGEIRAHVHVTDDVQPETLEALRELMLALMEWRTE